MSTRGARRAQLCARACVCVLCVLMRSDKEFVLAYFYDDAQRGHRRAAGQQDPVGGHLVDRSAVAGELSCECGSGARADAIQTLVALLTASEVNWVL